MSILVVGSTGMLGQAVCNSLRCRSIHFIRVARSNAELSIDLSTASGRNQLQTLNEIDLILNCAALTSLATCEQYPTLAQEVNANLPRELAVWAARIGVRYVHISTDHYFSGDARLKHAESSRVSLYNAYSRTKYLGELGVLEYPRSLVIRTNIVGFRGIPSQPTFLEWVLKQLQEQNEFTAYSDFYTSSLDADSLAEVLIDFMSMKTWPTGILNVASSEVSSKAEFISAVAEEFGFSTKKMKLGSVSSNPIPRAESLGLDVTKAEAILGRSLPGLKAVVKNLHDQYKKTNEI